MGTVIKFPDEGRTARSARAEGFENSGRIIILPVVRIERYLDAAPERFVRTAEPPARKGRRRRAKRR